MQGRNSNSFSETEALLARERQLAEGLFAALRSPRITLGTISATFLAPTLLVD